MLGVVEMPTPKEVVDYYERSNEDGRLRSGADRLELLRMRDILRRVLPPAPARILDAGGASGVHAEWLSRDGYRVHVVDPVAKHVRSAAALPGVTASVGDARGLDDADGSYDAVLLLGPLYHLVDRADRLAVLREAARVTRKCGTVAAATISRFTSLLDGVRRGFLAQPGVRPIVDRTLTDGSHLPGDVDLFTTAFLHYPDELAGEIRDAGLEPRATYAVEGPTWLIKDIDSWLDDEQRWELLLWGLRRIEREPAILGASRHLLTVAACPES